MNSAQKKKLAVLARRRDFLQDLVSDNIEGMEWNSYDAVELISLRWVIQIVEDLDAKGELPR